MSDFDLHDLFRQVHDTTDITDYSQMAKELRSRVPDEHAEDAFLVTLTEYCRVQSTKARHRSPELPRAVGRSQKRDAIRSWWTRLCSDRYATPDGVKLLGDCTPDDLVFMAETLERKAAENVARAEAWRSLAVEMQRRKVKRFRDLPVDIAGDALKEAA